jgi:two-component system sensor kinase FixL
MVMVGVADQGSGLPRGGSARVFEPFFTTKDKGMGMGLPISRSIVEAHGGKLWAAGEQDRGATFFFSLPTPTAHDEGYCRSVESPA